MLTVCTCLFSCQSMKKSKKTQTTTSDSTTTIESENIRVVDQKEIITDNRNIQREGDFIIELEYGGPDTLDSFSEKKFITIGGHGISVDKGGIIQQIGGVLVNKNLKKATIKGNIKTNDQGKTVTEKTGSDSTVEKQKQKTDVGKTNTVTEKQKERKGIAIGLWLPVAIVVVVLLALYLYFRKK